MATGFDDPGVFYSDQLYSDERSEAEDLTRGGAAQKRFKEFIKTFIDQENSFCYRCAWLLLACDAVSLTYMLYWRTFYAPFVGNQFCVLLLIHPHISIF